MGWLSILRGLFGITQTVLRMMADRQLLDAGEAKAIARNLTQANEKLDKALAARRNVKHDADSVSNDPANRDRQ